MANFKRADSKSADWGTDESICVCISNKACFVVRKALVPGKELLKKIIYVRVGRDVLRYRGTLL